MILDFKFYTMRFIILSIGLLLAFAPSRAQRQLDLKQCREMALEYSKQLAIAEKQKEKAVWTKKEYGANYLPKLSASGFYLYHQKCRIQKLYTICFSDDFQIFWV